MLTPEAWTRTNWLACIPDKLPSCQLHSIKQSTPFCPSLHTHHINHEVTKSSKTNFLRSPHSTRLTHDAATADVRPVAPTSPSGTTTCLDRASASIPPSALAVTTPVTRLWQPVSSAARCWAQWKYVWTVWQLLERPDRPDCCAVWVDSLQARTTISGEQRKYE